MKKLCVFCGCEFNAHENKNKFCSSDCYHSSVKGKPAWNKGIKRWWKSPTEFKKGCIKSPNAFVFGNKDKNPRWRGGVRYTAGYRALFCPEHPFATISGYVREHRLVVEKYLGRNLSPIENVHHINKDKLDNRVNNLYLFSTNAEHRKFEGLKNKPKLVSNLITPNQ